MDIYLIDLFLYVNPFIVIIHLESAEVFLTRRCDIAST